MSYLLGIDIGTTSTKAAVISQDRILGGAARPTTLRSPQAGHAEEDAEEWWSNACRIIPECLSRAGLSPRHVDAVGVSGMVPAVVLLDAQGRVVRPSIQQNDSRAAFEIEEQRRRTRADDILARTGSAITQQSVGPKLLWLRRHEPQSILRTAHVFGSYDFVVHRLTGSFSIERNWALESGLFDLQREDWDEELLGLSAIDRSWLAPVRRPSDMVGRVTGEASRATGLLSGTPVVAGSADHVASAFSGGLSREGDLALKLGGAGDILYCLSSPSVDSRLFLDYHVIPGKFVINGCMATSGSLIKWFRDQFAPGLDYAVLDSEAAFVPAGSGDLILLPYFLGEKTPINDPLARGTLVGLTLSHTRAHIYRAILEGIAYGFRHHVTVMAEHGHAARTARVTNGGARSALWKRVTADVLGLPLEHVADHPGSSLGVAFVAGMGVGAFRSWDEINRFISIDSVTEPDPDNHALHTKMFHLYREMYESLKDVYPRLAAAAAPLPRDP
jgi:xylulokinase